MYNLVYEVREAYIATKLSQLESKIDCLVNIVTRTAPEVSTTVPELPDDVNLPINSMTNLTSVEDKLIQDRLLKNSLVKSSKTHFSADPFTFAFPTQSGCRAINNHMKSM